MMLDNTMPMDMDEDLFGEGAADVMGSLMPLRPQNKHLRQRLDEMRSRGCCQYDLATIHSRTQSRFQSLTSYRAVSWSRTGTIASISADGTALELRHLRAHPKDGSWDLSDPVNSPLVQGTRSNPLVHLEWAATNSPELAIFDSVGRVAIISFAISLNNAFPMRSWEPDPIDDLNAVAGCYWLPVAPPQPQVGEHGREQMSSSRMY
jgi:mediator of RNA polymerase II transcription subunit 16